MDLRQRFPELLNQLGDDSAPKDCLAFYRPSFGRKGGPPSAEFGELDALAATRLAVYPIEAKWFRSAPRVGLVRLKGHQVLRHKIFEWLRDRWVPGMAWLEFSQLHAAAFTEAFSLKPLAPGGSSLAQNLSWIIDQLTTYLRPMQHVVIIFHSQGRHAPHAVAPYEVPFHLVTFSIHTDERRWIVGVGIAVRPAIIPLTRLRLWAKNRGRPSGSSPEAA